jgi:ribonuclease Z
VVYPASGQVFFERLRHASSFYEVATLVPRPVQAAPDEEVEVCRAGSARLEEVSEARAGQAFALVMDTRPCPGAEALARGADLLVCESTYQMDAAPEARERFHMTVAGAAELAARAGVRRLGLTHFSQRYAGPDGFRAEAEALHADVFCAGDLDRLEVPARRDVKTL